MLNAHGLCSGSAAASRVHVGGVDSGLGRGHCGAIALFQGQSVILSPCAEAHCCTSMPPKHLCKGILYLLCCRAEHVSHTRIVLFDHRPHQRQLLGRG